MNRLKHMKLVGIDLIDFHFVQVVFIASFRSQSVSGRICIFQSLHSMFYLLCLIFDLTLKLTVTNKIRFVLPFWADCYSSLEDQHCKKNGTENDEIFWQKKCTDISTICSRFDLTGVNASFCMNTTTKEPVPIRKLITRTLASEEYY